MVKKSRWEQLDESFFHDFFIEVRPQLWSLRQRTRYPRVELVLIVFDSLEAGIGALEVVEYDEPEGARSGTLDGRISREELVQSLFVLLREVLKRVVIGCEITLEQVPCYLVVVLDKLLEATVENFFRLNTFFCNAFALSQNFIEPKMDICLSCLHILAF